MAGAITPVFQNIWDSTQGQMNTLSANLAGSLQVVMQSWFVASVAAYLVIMLFIAMWSAEELAVLRFWRQLMYAALIYTFIYSLPYYNEWVPGLVQGTTAKLTSGVIGTAGATSIPDSFNHIAVKSFDVALAVQKALPHVSYMGGFGLEIACGLYMLFVQIFIWAVFGLFLIASLLTTYIVAYGPVFIVMAFFEQTRMFFDGWFRAVVAGMLVQLFLIGDLSLINGAMLGLFALIKGGIDPNGANAATGDIGFMLWNMFGCLGLCFLFVKLALISVFIAVQISGGAHHQLLRYTGGGGRPSSPSSAPSPSSPSPGSSGGSVSGGGGSPPRSYAFQTSTPMGAPP
jgi:hypothetical protein